MNHNDNVGLHHLFVREGDSDYGSTTRGYNMMMDTWEPVNLHEEDEEDYDPYEEDVNDDGFYEDDPYEDEYEITSVREFTGATMASMASATQAAASATTTAYVNGTRGPSQDNTLDTTYEILYDELGLPVDTLRNEHCYINDDFNVLYWFLRNLGELNGMALGYDRVGLTLQDLERDLAKFDLILTQKQNDFSRINIRQIKEFMVRETPRLIEHCSNDFIRIIGFNLHKGYWTVIRDDLGSGANVKMVFLAEFMKVVLDRVQVENPDLMRGVSRGTSLYDKFITQIRNGHSTIGDNSVHGADYFRKLWKPLLMLDNSSFASPFEEAVECLNRLLSWDRTAEGSEFWNRINSRANDVVKDIHRHTTNVDLFAMIKKYQPVQIRVNTDSRMEFVEPTPLASSDLLQAIA